ncbi:MAG: hypothetical protein CVU42_06905 [Chloroflexi bacterium HGW-Chloroflexi-4]|jgi:uncharacterized protein|nr:MAG: hypothetical protein CVU42_06905 [Chloroflexi bacterium HGW-Chloroflexi-4]
MLTLENALIWYEHINVVNGFSHIERVYKISERLALAENADLDIVHAAALLHDVEGTVPGSEAREQHHLLSANFAGRILQNEGWSEDRIKAVQHCIRTHRYRCDSEIPATIEAKCISDSENLDVLGAIGAIRTMLCAAIDGSHIDVRPSQQFLENWTKKPDELYSAYHEYLFKIQKVEQKLFTQTAREIAKNRREFLNLFIEQLIAEIKGEK